MEAICAARPDIHRMRRVITRDPNAGGEDYDYVTPALLARLAPPMPVGLQVTEVDNSGQLATSVRKALTALYPERV